MSYFLNTPLQLPLPLPALSPFITANNHFNSPFISPYTDPLDNHYHTYNHNHHDEFSNFHLDQQPQLQQKQEPVCQESMVQEKQQEPIQSKQPVQESDEESILSDEDCEISQKIKKMISLLVKHVDKGDQKLQIEKQKCVANDKALGQVFDILVRKFRKLKKTKEQMTKYCMRKAFKFLADKQKKVVEGKDATEFLKEYFDQVEAQGFCIPFKKNSEEKTMNSNFLKKVFTSPKFASDYKQFLKTFSKLVDEDNDKKVKYLTSIIKSFYRSGTLKKLENVKRLPWTENILDKTIDLANKLISNSSGEDYIRDSDSLKPKKSQKEKQDLVRSPSVRRKSTVSLAETLSSPSATNNIPVNSK